MDDTFREASWKLAFEFCKMVACRWSFLFFTSHMHTWLGNRLLSAEISVGVWKVNIYIRMHRLTGVRMHVSIIKRFEHLQLTWACRVLRQEWRGWLWVCFQTLSGCFYTFSVGTRSPTRPPVGSPLPVFSRIWFTKSEVWPATGDCTALGERMKIELKSIH